MKSVGMFEAKTRFSEICDEVARTGSSVTVTRHGKPLVNFTDRTHGRIELLLGCVGLAFKRRRLFAQLRIMAATIETPFGGGGVGRRAQSIGACLPCPVRLQDQTTIIIQIPVIGFYPTALNQPELIGRRFGQKNIVSDQKNRSAKIIQRMYQRFAAINVEV